jgi:DNA polymerase III delta subunit
MLKKVLHGEHEVASRRALQAIIDELRQQGRELRRIDARKASRAEIEQALGASSLFGDDEVVIIEGLHSLPRGKKRTELMELVSSADRPLVLWEKRSLTKTMLKRFADAEVKEFKLGKPLFDWLDSLQGNSSGRQRQRMLQLLHRALEQEDECFAFAMLVRQVRLLLQAVEGSKIKGHPFVVKKINRQARSFDEATLVAMHARLTELDYRLKTGQLPQGMATALDQLLLEM